MANLYMYLRSFFSVKQVLRFSGVLILVLMLVVSVQSQNGLKVEYYNGTNFNQLVSTSIVPNINAAWYSNPPAEGMDPHKCSIRWTGKLKPGKTGRYTFSAQVDDGIRVWIDQQLIIDQWDLNDLGVFEGTIELKANYEYDLKVEYFNGMIEGEVRLLWKKHKEELSWYERVFGDGILPTVITSDNFIPPMTPEKVEKTEEKVVTPPKPKKKAAPRSPKERDKIPRPTREISQPRPKPQVDAKIAEKYIPKNVQFEKGKTVILESSYKELDNFVSFLKRHPQLKVMIEGHTDVIGDAALNLQLSENRAITIKNYMSERGVDERRIKSKGFGGTKPLKVPKNGKYYPANRRVVFVLDGL